MPPENQPMYLWRQIRNFARNRPTLGIISVVSLGVITIYLYNFLRPSIKLPQKVFESLTEEERNRFWQASADIHADFLTYNPLGAQLFAAFRRITKGMRLDVERYEELFGNNQSPFENFELILCLRREVLEKLGV
jgi:hypothetical protein